MEHLITVIIADDEHLVRKGIRHLLSQQDEFQLIAEAENGREAVDKVRKYRPGIVILDVKMPVLDGLESTKKIKSICPETKIIILSGHDEFAFAQRALKFGASEYILKPTSLTGLLDALKRLKIQILKEKKRETLFVSGMSAFLEQFYEKLLFGGLIREELQERLGIFNIKEDAASVLLIGFDQTYMLSTIYSRDQYDDMCSALKSSVEYALAAEDSANNPVLKLNDGTCAVIYFSSFKHDAKTFADVLFKRIRSEHPLTLAVGMEAKLPQLIDSLRDARVKMKQRIILGGNRVIKERVETSRIFPCYPQELEKRLVKALRFGDFTGTKAILGELFQELKSAGLSPESWQQVCFEIMESGYRMLSELNVPIQPSMSLLVKSKEIIELGSMEDMLRWLEKNLNAILELSNSCNSGPSIAIKKAVSFIHDRFSTDINLSNLADHVCLSPNYVSRLFKRETGKTFLEYLTSCRINEAKKLLTGTNLNVSEIAYQIGYDNPRYFSELFNKHENVTPSQYRKGLSS